MENKYKTENRLKIKITLINGWVFKGVVNIIDYNRLSDFIDKGIESHIKLYKIGYDNEFMLIPKTNILYYEEW